MNFCTKSPLIRISVFLGIYLPIHVNTFSQNLESIGKDRPFAVTGGVSANQIFYTASGIESRRDPYSYFLSGNVNFSVYGWSVPLSFSYSNQNVTFLQPFNQYSIHPTYKWVTGHLGYTSMSFSPYTVSGHIFLGGGVDVAPEGKWKLSALYGRFLKAVEYDSTRENVLPAYSRIGYGFKASYGEGGNFADIIIFHAEDDVNSITRPPDSLQVFPQENLVMSIATGKTFFNHFILRGEFATSALSRDTRTAETSHSHPFAKTGFLYQPRASSSYYNAFKTSLDFQQDFYALGVAYERIDPQYRTLGAYYFNNDLESISANGTTTIMQNKMNIAVSAGTQRDNLDKSKVSTMARMVGSININYMPSEQLNFSTSYSTFQSYTNIRSQFVDINQLTPYGCLAIETQVITDPPVLNFSLAGTENIKCFDGNNGKITLQASGGAGNLQFSLDQSTWKTTSEFSSLKALAYTAYVKDINGCTKNLTTTLTQPTKIGIAFATEPAFCKDPRGTATATVTGGVGGYEYEWRDDLTNTMIGTSNAIINKTAGNYTLTVIDNNDCPASKTAAITSTDGAKVNVKEVVGAKCSYSADGSGLLEIVEGEGPFTYRWPNGQTTIKGINLAQGTYNVLVTDVRECVVVKQVVIPAPVPLAINLSGDSQPSCFGTCDGSITVIGQGGVGPYTFTWANQIGDQAQNLCTGVHTVRVNDANNCTTEKAFQLGQPEPLQLQLSNRTLPLCSGSCDGSIAVGAKGGNGNYQFLWNSGQTTATASQICAGDHTVVVTDSKNCRLESTYQLGEPTKLQIRLVEKQIPTCHNGCDGTLKVEGYGGVGNYQYEWNTSVIQSEINNLCSTDYSVSVTDANLCNTTQDYTIENPPALIIDLGGSVVLCEGQTHTLDAGPTWTTYKWGSNTSVSATTQQLTVQDAGQYWVDVVNFEGCSVRDTFLLETSRDLLKASFLIPKEALTGDTVAIIDVSWPMPGSTIWTFPSAMRKLIDLGDLVYGQFDEPGIYEIGLKTILGKCVDEIGKSILILQDEEDVEGGRLGYESFVKEFVLYPNPSDGSFEVSAEFMAVAKATISIWNTTSGHMLLKNQDAGKAKYMWSIDLRPVSPGTYVLRLDYDNGTKYIRFIVN